MTYHMTKTRRPVRAPAMGDWISDMLKAAGVNAGPSPEAKCVDAANATVAPLDARTNNLAATWNPTGFYTPDQVLSIVSQGWKLGTASNDRVRTAPAAGYAATLAAQAIDTVQRKMGDGKKYSDAANAAKSAGVTVVDAPGLRDWMIQMMRASSDALVTASTLDCNTPWLATVVLTMQPLFEAAAAVVKRIVGVVIAAGQAVVKVATALPDIVTYVKWGGLAALGVAAVYKIKQMRDGR